MIKPELKRLLAEHKKIIYTRKKDIEAKIGLLNKSVEKARCNIGTHEEVNKKLNMLAIELLKKIDFPFGSYRIKLSEKASYCILLDIENDMLKYKEYRKRYWNYINFLGSNNTSTKLVLSMLGRQFVMLVMECESMINKFDAKKQMINDEVIIDAKFNIEYIDEFEIKKGWIKEIECARGADNVSFDGEYGGDSSSFFADDRIYNKIIEEIEAKMNKVDKTSKELNKMYKEIESHINEPYLTILGLE